MVSTLTLVLIGVLLYTVVTMTLRQRDVLPEFVKVSGPLTTIHTQRGKAFLNRLAQRKRFWRAWGNLGVGIALVFLVGSFLTVLLSAWQNIQQPELTPIRSPQDALVIPGVNRFLPLEAAPDIMIGLLIGLVVHEGGHGLLCRVEDIDIDSMGVALFTILPIGAFVEPDEESRKKAGRGAQARMFAAGVTNNFAITIIAFALLFGPITGAIAVADGVPVGGSLPNSSASEAGLGNGDVITGVNGTTINNQTELGAAINGTTGPLLVDTKDGEQHRVERSILVQRAIPNGPLGVDVGDTITAVNGTNVTTEVALQEALQDRTVATLTVEDDNDTTTTTGPIGAASVVTANGSLSGQFDSGTSLVITQIEGARIVDANDLISALDSIDPGTSVSVEAFVEGERQTITVETGDGGDGGSVLGISVSRGISGLVVTDFGIDVYPASQFLSLLSGEGVLGALDQGSLGRAVLALLILPLAAASDPSLGYSFAGFLGPIANFYTVQGPLSVLGGGTFFIANVLFWTGWVNFNLGLFNCIPAFPLDGGHILRASTETILSRTPLHSRQHVRVVTTSIGLVMLGSLLIMLFGPLFLS